MRFGLDLWNPGRPFGRELVSLQREMDRLFDQFTSQLPRIPQGKSVDFVPACDVEETDNQYALKIDVPGFKKDNLKVELSDNVLTISGEYKEEKKEGKKNDRVCERCQGYFERSFMLPQASESNKVEASYSDGVLHITVPKVAAAKTKQIPIAEGKPAIKGATKETKPTTESQKTAVAA